MTEKISTPLKMTDYRYADNSFNGVPYVTDANGQYVCTGFMTEEHAAVLAEVVRRANCHDELLSALRDLVVERDNFGGCPNSSPVWDFARSLIAKATGDSANVPA